MIIKLLVDGGAMKPGPTIAQKLGPIGINMGKLISDINEATKEFSGIKVPVSVDINTKTKTYKIEVFSPSVAEMLKKEFSLEKGSGQPHKIKTANVALEQIIKIAKMKESGMLVKDFKSALKSVLGSCVSLGILVENKDPRVISKEISKGVYDKIIAEGKTSVSPEKKAKLDEYFEKIKKAQEELLRKEEEEKKAKEEAAAAAAVTTPTTAPATEKKEAVKTSAAAPLKEEKAKPTKK